MFAVHINEINYSRAMTIDEANNKIINDIKEHKTIQIYLFKSEQLELKPLDPNNPEARWVTIDRAYDLLTHIEDKIFLKKTLSLWFQ